MLDTKMAERGKIKNDFFGGVLFCKPTYRPPEPPRLPTRRRTPALGRYTRCPWTGRESVSTLDVQLQFDCLNRAFL